VADRRLAIKPKVRVCGEEKIEKRNEKREFQKGLKNGILGPELDFPVLTQLSGKRPRPQFLPLFSHFSFLFSHFSFLISLFSFLSSPLL
jgi:hypothetical protein